MTGRSVGSVQTEGWYDVDAAALPSSAMRRTSIAVAATALVVAVLAVAACGGDEAAVETVTVTETVQTHETSPTTSGGPAAGSPGSAAGTCEDVTSYDYNWDNDMKCTRSDGSTFYTDYAGAERFERNGDE